jgi:hypothetical protein
MQNPLEVPPPDDLVERIHILARDLAWGAVNKMWGVVISVTPHGVFWIGYSSENREKIEAYLEHKWQGNPPSPDFLIAFGYLAFKNEANYGTDYLLTEKAFQLLEKPVATKVFISYNRAESSAFALLILARLKAVGIDAFLDLTGLTPGEDWRLRLENEVKTREHFICLIGPQTLASPYARDEIAWAMQSDRHTIPIWHNGFRLNTDDASALGNFLNKNAIVVENENAKAYNNAVIELLNYFGFTPP